VRSWCGALLTVALLGTGAACGGGDGDGDDDAGTVPAVELVDPAVAAVESQRGGAQDYFEINVTGSTVNLFVATDGATTATAYSYLGGELLPADAAQPASGATFRADALTFDADTVLDGVMEELDDPVIARFVIVGGPGGAVQYAATVTSAQGGQLDVLLAPDGTIQGVDLAADLAEE
jgi:hypothetical protein